MKQTRTAATILFLCMLALASNARAVTYTFKTIDYPSGYNTSVTAINDSGQVAGNFDDASGYHGFLYSGGKFTKIDYADTFGEVIPTGDKTSVIGINKSGQVLGKYLGGMPGGSDVDSIEFIYDGRGYTFIDMDTADTGINDSGQVVGCYDDCCFVNRVGIPYPSRHTVVWAYGINNNGEVFGQFCNDDWTICHSFLFSDGVYTKIDYPSAAAGSTIIEAINDDGQAVGQYVDAAGQHGFLYSEGAFTNIDPPSAIIGDTDACCINNGGTIAGHYREAAGRRNFVYNQGVFTALDDPSGTGSTFITGINNDGRIVGYYQLEDVSHGFIATLAYSISGTVNDHKGLPAAGVTVTLGGAKSATTQTAADGTWSFSGLPSGNYTIRPSKGNFTFTPASLAVMIANQDLASNNFTVKNYLISGKVKDKKGSPIRDANVALGGASPSTTRTDPNGHYSFCGLANGSYTITPSEGLYAFTPSSAKIVFSGKDVTVRDFTGSCKNSSISGKILDGKGSPVTGVSVTMSGASSRKTQTSSNGTYSFSNVPAGNYTIKAAKDLYTFAPAEIDLVLSGTDVTVSDFTGKQTKYYISGYIQDGDGVTLTLSGGASATTQTDSDGFFIFSGLANGAYTITPSLANSTFKPLNRGVKIKNKNISGVDFNLK